MYDTQYFSNYELKDDMLSNKVILVTGAGDGIGRTAAITYAKLGATVVLLGRTLHKLEAVYDEIDALELAQPAIFPMNLEGATEHDIDAMHDSLNEEFGRLDGLLHNASALGPRTPLTNYPITDWQTLLQVNVTAPFLMTQKLLPLLEQSESGSVVFTSSSVGKKGRAFWGAYAMTKAAIENLVETWADELDETSKIRINSINPGATRTSMRASAYPAEDPSTVVAAEDIMKAYVFLMGDDSKDLSGEHLDAQDKR